jgi:ABC-2 type transport system ATP-binding protein
VNVLETAGLSKRYGRVQALRSLDLAVPQGSVFGILGPNGSGKTTALGIVLGAIHPDAGRYAWSAGAPGAAHPRIGSLLEVPAFYPALSGTENLVVVARIRGCGVEGIDEALAQAGLFERRHSPVATYSLGMRQRLAIAAARLGAPDVVVLDEPGNGLDPEGIADVRGAIRRLATGRVTVILASHVLDEVQKLCTHVAVLKHGRLLAAGDIDAVVAGAARLEDAYMALTHGHDEPPRA